jgi:hypothetical protein
MGGRHNNHADFERPNLQLCREGMSSPNTVATDGVAFQAVRVFEFRQKGLRFVTAEHSEIANHLNVPVCGHAHYCMLIFAAGMQNIMCDSKVSSDLICNPEPRARNPHCVMKAHPY